MTQTSTALSDLDQVFEPLEARPVVLSREDIAARQRNLGLGWEMSRLQGATMTTAWRRLLNVYACGQISAQEYRSIGLSLAKSGALTTDRGPDGR